MEGDHRFSQTSWEVIAVIPDGDGRYCPLWGTYCGPLPAPMEGLARYSMEVMTAKECLFHFTFSHLARLPLLFLLP